MEVQTAETGSQTALDVRVDAQMTEKARDAVGRVVAQSDLLYNTVCLADKATRAQYEKMLADNRAVLGKDQ
jgi:hypothetical protein